MRSSRSVTGPFAHATACRRSKRSSKSCRLLLVDMSLQGMSGSAFLRFVRDNPTWSRIPRVIMTATNDPMMGVREDTPVFYKPLDFDSLLAVVQRHCDRAQPQVSAVTARQS